MNDASTGEGPPDQDFVTIIRSKHLLFAKKIFEDGRVEDYDQVKTIDIRSVSVSGLDDVLGLLRKLVDRPDCAAVFGEIADPDRTDGVRRLDHPDVEHNYPSTLKAAVHRWCAVDMDDVERPDDVPAEDLSACAALAVACLPGAFHGARCVAQATASHGKKPGCRMRLWFWLSRPVTGTEMKFWLKPYPIDPCTFVTAQAIYTAAPVFIRCSDHLPSRLVDIPGRNFVEVPAKGTLDPPPVEEWVVGDFGTADDADVEAFVAAAVGRVRDARDGTKHSILLAQARLLGGVQVEAGFTDGEAVGRLVSALTGTVKSVSAAEKTVREGLAMGRARPIPVPVRWISDEEVRAAERLIDESFDDYEGVEPPIVVAKEERAESQDDASTGRQSVVRVASVTQSAKQSLEETIRNEVPAQVPATFVRVLLDMRITAVEEDRLLAIAVERSGVGKAALKRDLRTAREDAANKRADIARRTHSGPRTRTVLHAPMPEDERLPTMRAVDRILTASTETEPPVRDLDGRPVYIHVRSPMMLHELTSDGANEDEKSHTRLPAPLMPLMTRHDRFTLSNEIEHRIEFERMDKKGIVRPVALPPVFVEHFEKYRESAMPKIGAIVTAPLVLSDGRMLSTNGLDRDRKVVFRIDTAMMAILPTEDEIDDDAVAEAMNYLVNEWFVDVTTSFAGKCVLVALAASILERVLLPGRPVFWVTAGLRGGGKTTALKMVATATTGRGAGAGAWSSNEEERRKAALAYLSDGLPFMVWDNIPTGTTVRCPTIEKISTEESYTDRQLGRNDSMVVVPCHTIMAFTGNNVGPEGDLLSRSLCCRIEVERDDPENRTFTHPDPILWTSDHRGDLLRCIYTVLLGNPRLKQGRKERAPARTRFKEWWHLVGSAVEHAAALMVERERGLVNGDRPTVMATVVDFGAMVFEAESSSEEITGNAHMLSALARKWKKGATFSATDIVDFAKGALPEDEDAAMVGDHFRMASRLRGDQVLTTRMVGKTLSKIVGSPMRFGEDVLRLDTGRGFNNTTAYLVKIIGEDAEDAAPQHHRKYTAEDHDEDIQF